MASASSATATRSMSRTPPVRVDSDTSINTTVARSRVSSDAAAIDAFIGDVAGGARHLGIEQCVDIEFHAVRLALQSPRSSRAGGADQPVDATAQISRCRHVRLQPP